MDGRGERNLEAMLGASSGRARAPRELASDCCDDDRPRPRSRSQPPYFGATPAPPLPLAPPPRAGRAAASSSSGGYESSSTRVVQGGEIPCGVCRPAARPPLDTAARDRLADAMSTVVRTLAGDEVKPASAGWRCMSMIALDLRLSCRAPIVLSPRVVLVVVTAARDETNRDRSDARTPRPPLDHERARQR